MMKTKINIFLFLFFSTILVAQSPIESFVNNPLHQNSNISVLIIETKTGKLIASHRPNNVAITASTMKAITTATALEILGKDYRFKTTLSVDGTISPEGVLNGRIIIYGSGDPTLGSAKLGNINFLNDWLAAIQSLGIKKINGNIIADASAYDSEGVNPKWLWEDVGNYFASGAYGISYKDNTYLLALRSGLVGTTPEVISITPNIPELQFTSQLKSSSITYDNAYIYGSPFSNERVIYGEIPANRASFTIRGDIPNPALILARDLAWKLKSNSIPVEGIATTGAVNGIGKVFHTHHSPTLQLIIREINVTSNNHYAEHLFRHLALQQEKTATTSAAIKVIREFWQAKGLPAEQLMMQDGSGLSPTNVVSAQFFVSLLNYMDKSPNAQVFRNSLPVAGKEGTVSLLLRNTPLAGKVSLKSGTISGVRAYVGYIDSGNKNYSFAILVNYPNTSSIAATTKKIEQLLLDVSK